MAKEEGRQQTTSRKSVIGLLAQASRDRQEDEPLGKVGQITFDGKKPGSGKGSNADANAPQGADGSPKPMKSRKMRVSSDLSESFYQGSGTADKSKSRASVAGNRRPLQRTSCRQSASHSPQVQNQRLEELRIGEMWNRYLLNPANRENVEICERFWSEIKVRIIRHFGCISKAFRQIDTSGDGQISFLEFVEMLNAVHFPLETQVARKMFEKASGGDLQLSLEELKMLLMERTIQKLQSAMRGFNKKQDRVRKHIHCFLKNLCLADETLQARSVDRLQRKLTIQFCRMFWQKLRVHLAKIHSDGTLERSAFMQIAQGEVGTNLMAVEAMFLLCIFDRIDSHSHGSVQLPDLMTTLVLLSDESSKEEKLHFLFQVFDTDFDGCLLYDQILIMMKCICAHRPIVEDHHTGTTQAATIQAAAIESGQTFQEELTSQDGLKLYECLFWYLQRSAKLDSDVVTWEELWQAFEKQPEVINAVLPGLFHIQWILKSTAVEDLQNYAAPQDEPASCLDHAGALDRSAGQRSSLPTRTATPPQEQVDPFRRQRSPSDTADTKGGTAEQLEGRRTGTWDAKMIELSSNRPRADSEQSQVELKQIRRRAQTDSILTHPKEHTWAKRRGTQYGHKPSSKVQPLSTWDMRETTATFKRAVTNSFKTSLRNFGDVRRTELEEGFKSVEEQLAAARDTDSGASPTAGAGNAAGDMDRLTSAAGAQRFTMELSRPGSSPAASIEDKFTDKLGSATMPRISSAPAGLFGTIPKLHRSTDSFAGSRPGSQPSNTVKSRGGQSVSQLRIPNSTEKEKEFPTIDSNRWGFEAIDRFRLFSTIRSGKNNQRHLMGCGCTDGMCYKCQLCQREHVMLASF